MILYHISVFGGTNAEMHSSEEIVNLSAISETSRKLADAEAEHASKLE